MWPVKDLVLVSPGSDLYGVLRGQHTEMNKIKSDSELRAHGFSYSGRTLIVATSSEISLFSRVVR
jgi:hypothetical protein